MVLKRETLEISVEGATLDANLVFPSGLMPAVLLVHGWDSDQQHYQDRADQLASLGCVCMTFDLRGHGKHETQHDSVSGSDNLRDVLAAFDALAGNPLVDRDAICLIGTSYGGYLAAIACGLRQVRWLALRVPALYEDRDWEVPKAHIERKRLKRYREGVQAGAPSQALEACHGFRGDVLLVESENDEVIPHATVAAYVGSFGQSASLTHRCLRGADHELSDKQSQDAYDGILLKWVAERMLGARDS